MIKDYYAILQIPPHASLPEIRSAFRRLAMTYHPDKNPGDPFKAARFSEIKEAYEVLTNPVKKEIYLQERWYNQSIGKKRTSEMVTPVSVLQLILELEKYVSTLDIHRMNKEGLSNYVLDLLSAETIWKLQQFRERDVNRQIITTILMAIKPLPLKSIKQVSGPLETLAGDDDISRQRISEFLLSHKKRFLWEKYKVVVIILFTALICLLIFFTSR